jgi:hypothetical protein
MKSQAVEKIMPSSSWGEGLILVWQRQLWMLPINDWALRLSLIEGCGDQGSDMIR